MMRVLPVAAYIRLVGDGYSVILRRTFGVRITSYKYWERNSKRATSSSNNGLATERKGENLVFTIPGLVELSEQACTGMIYMK